MTAAALRHGPIGLASRAMLTIAPPLSQTCAVRLIDRRTGNTHRINGSPLVLFTAAPVTAAAQLLAGRDSAVWEARVEPIGIDARHNGGRE